MSAASERDAPPIETEIRSLVRDILLRLDESSGNQPEPQKSGSRRSILDAADIARLPRQATLELAKDTLITPLALDAARDRGITISRTDAVPSGSLSPSSERSIAVAADHGGFTLKELLKPYIKELGYEPVDLGTFNEESVDYPDYAYAAANLVAQKRCQAAIIIDGAGIGSCMTANKVPGVRASMCYDVSTASNAREHNHANVLTLGAGLIGLAAAKQIVKTWLETPWGGDRHARRVDKIMAVEKRYCK